MKVNKKLAVGAAALLLAGSLGVTAIHTFAQTAQPTAQERLGTPGITFGQAAAAAEAHLNDGSASEVELESKAGQLIYTVEIGASEVRVDAMSGEVLGVDSDQDDDEKDTTSLGTPEITFDQAQAAAEAHLNAGSASEIELENENGQLVYSVEIGRVEVKVDAMTGAVLGVEAEDGHDAAPTDPPTITSDQAKTAAEAHLNAGTATKVELDAEDGKWVYSVEIGTSEVKVDAMTGAVLGVDSGQD